MNDQFKKLLGLVKRTGDRLVVTDPDGEHAYVILDLAAYEAMQGAPKPSPASAPTPPPSRPPFTPARPEPRSTPPAPSGEIIPPPPTPQGPIDETPFYLEPVE